MLNFLDTMQIWYSDGVIFEIKCEQLCNQVLLVVREYDYEMHQVANVVPYIINTETIPQGIETISDIIETCNELHDKLYESKAYLNYCYFQTNNIVGNQISFAYINLDIQEIDTGDNWIFIVSNAKTASKKEVTEEEMLTILRNYKLLNVLFGKEI